MRSDFFVDIASNVFGAEARGLGCVRTPVSELGPINLSAQRKLGNIYDTQECPLLEFLSEGRSTRRKQRLIVPISKSQPFSPIEQIGGVWAAQNSS